MASRRTMRVTLDGTHEYEVPHNDLSWNGFAVPGFTLTQARQLAHDIDAELNAAAAAQPSHLNESDTLTVDEHGTVTFHTSFDGSTILEPAADGLYYIGGFRWAWQIID
ncbi:hypothetical protein MXD59_19115 [Frankia sp. Ag45/Mut15]|uniref:Uncharacterized protein n=1 Tax=Frankia umida TaxID=573489 RepID=A0ABT0K243_9ACTN|nr:hypothetical protein [Frankia umida]MCK9877861.1 hypothetical protein [Frankia umida]